MDYFVDLLKINGVNDTAAIYLYYGILVFVILLVSTVINAIMKKVILKIYTKILLKRKMDGDNILRHHKVFYRLLYLVPAIVVYFFAPAFGAVVELVRRSAAAYFLLASVFIVNAMLDAVNELYRNYSISKVRPIKGILQVIQIAYYIIIGIVIIPVMMGKSPLLLLSGIGALAAVFSFVFKDSILGFIAGILLTSNDMLRIGDWIEMQKYGADGDVIDITLNTVKVQNFDKTFVTIPAYAMVSDSFKNWRGMTEFGGRRIKRAIYIDMNSVKFCTPTMIETYKKIHFLNDYITERENDIEAYNREHDIDTSVLVNGRHMTNIGTFRAYLGYYLKNNEELIQDPPPFVRQLQPGENGVPIEIYGFTRVIQWDLYEAIQADIFDHIFSVAELFELRIFQSPSGYDFRLLSEGMTDLTSKIVKDKD